MRKKIVIITGAASGLGRSLAYTLAQQGYWLGLIDTSKQKLNDVKKIISNKYPINCMIFPANINSLQEMKIAVSYFEKNLGACQVFIANAAVAHGITIAKLDEKQTTQVINTNLAGTIQSIAAIVPHMIKRAQGQLVVISSLATMLPLPQMGVYAASKAGLNAYLKSLELELWSHNIVVTRVSPGWIKTPMTAELSPFNMPFSMDSDKASRHIYRAILKRKRYASFPKRAMLLLSVLRLLQRLSPRATLKLIAKAKNLWSLQETLK